MDLADRVGEDAGDPDIDLRKTPAAESLAFQLDDEVAGGQGHARDVVQGPDSSTSPVMRFKFGRPDSLRISGPKR